MAQPGARRVDHVGVEVRPDTDHGDLAFFLAEELGDLLLGSEISVFNESVHTSRANAGLNQRRAARARDTSGRVLSTVILARASTR